MRSDRYLKRCYNKINKKFFDGVLPNNVCVRWATSEEEPDFASCIPTIGRHKFLILMNEEKNIADSQTVSTLVHEMVHVATECTDCHGQTFDEWLVWLVNKGIFKKGAILRGLTIF